MRGKDEQCNKIKHVRKKGSNGSAWGETTRHLGQKQKELLRRKGQEVESLERS